MCSVVSAAGVLLIVGVVGLSGFTVLWFLGDVVWVTEAYVMLWSAVGCMWLIGSMLGLWLGVFDLWLPTLGVLEL